MQSTLRAAARQSTPDPIGDEVGKSPTFRKPLDLSRKGPAPPQQQPIFWIGHVEDARRPGGISVRRRARRFSGRKDDAVGIGETLS